MADPEPTPPPKEYVTTRTPTPVETSNTEQEASEAEPAPENAATEKVEETAAENLPVENSQTTHDAEANVGEEAKSQINEEDKTISANEEQKDTEQPQQNSASIEETDTPKEDGQVKPSEEEIKDQVASADLDAGNPEAAQAEPNDGNVDAPLAEQNINVEDASGSKAEAPQVNENAEETQNINTNANHASVVEGQTEPSAEAATEVATDPGVVDKEGSTLSQTKTNIEGDKSKEPSNVSGGPTDIPTASRDATDIPTASRDATDIPAAISTEPTKASIPQTLAPSTAPLPGPPPATAETELPPPKEVIPSSPKPPSPEKTVLSSISDVEDDANIITGNALSVVWSFGQNKNVPMINLSTDKRSIILYACAHTGICYNYETNTQKLLQGHNNNISCICVSEDKKWLATADKGPNNCMVIIWDTDSFFPVQTIFDAGEQGLETMALTPDARYLVTISAGSPQLLCIWDWTVEGDYALCSATLDPSYGVQNFVLFNPDDTTQIVSNSDNQVIFYAWDGGELEYFCPPLTDDDFNKPVGKYTQSIFLENSNKCLTATSIGNLVVWASNKPLTRSIDNEPTPNKKALKLVKVQDRGINVLKIVDSQILMGDVNGHVKLFDQTLNLIHWYQDLHVGPINAISFTYVEKWGIQLLDQQDYPSDCSLSGRTLPIRDFVVGSTQSVYALITPKGTDINVILRNHDSPINAIVTHPSDKKLFIGSYSGLLQMWDYETRTVVASRKFDRSHMIQCIAVDPKGHFIAIGFTNGMVRVVDALNLSDETSEPFRYARDAITRIKFSHDSNYLATADGEFTTTLFKRQRGSTQQSWIYVGRYKAHYKEIKDLCFGVELDSSKPRLLTLGKDRTLVEYDLEASSKDNLVISNIERIEQSAVPLCMDWYPPLSKEHFIVTVNDQYKFKLYNVTTKRCRKTILGPTYGSPLKRICILPTADEVNDKRYLAYINNDKIGLHILPLDGNPHNSMALVAHPSGVSEMAASYDGKYLFSTGGDDTTVHMWHVNLAALEAQAKLGGEGLIPFYGLMEGGREGELFAELEDYFYYAQLRHQGINTMMRRQVDTKIALSEVPYVMRAMGFYPTEQEVEDMLNEVKFSQYVETGQDVTDIDLEGFIKLYINHRPAFGLNQERIAWCFEALSGRQGENAMVKRGQFLDLLQRKGEHMTEYELSEYLTTLLGYNEEGGSCEQHQFDASEAGNIIIENLPVDISSKTFTDDLLGFGFYESPDILTIEHDENTKD